MKNESSSKGLYIGLAVVVIIAVAYFLLTGKPSADATATLETTQVEGAADAQIVGARVLNLLAQIESLDIDSSLFENLAYKTLIDYTITIPEQPVGRPNPFAPIPGQVRPASTGTNR